MSTTLPETSSQLEEDLLRIETPPETLGATLRRIGPGLIVAGSIVGSGELIATTKAGAEAGFWLLWLIMIGCVIKVFVQVEFGRYTIYSGKTALYGMNEVPGPAISYRLVTPARVNWLMIYWFIMTAASIAQLGGIVGGVGQALQMGLPLTEKGRYYNEFGDLQTRIRVTETLIGRAAERSDAEEEAAQKATLAKLEGELDEQGARYLALRLAIQEESRTLAALDPASAEAENLQAELKAQKDERKAIQNNIEPIDDEIWAAVLGIGTAILLLVGRYRFIESISTALVASFTLVTVGNLLALQLNPDWAVTPQEFLRGLSFRFTPESEAIGVSPLMTALATFGIIGVGATELIAYPYWCLEKGYARFTGPRDDSPEWGERAAGWMRVMRCDAWCSMIVYTFATLAFYLLGAAILGRIHLIPESSEMIRSLSVMYEPVFGAYAPPIFLFGAFAVLYSTFFVANACHARVNADGLQIFGMLGQGDATYRAGVKFLCGFFPLICIVIYIVYPHPTFLVIFSGMMQAIMLPMLSAAALYFRYYHCDKRIAPGIAWDICLWLSAIGMLIAGGYLAYAKTPELVSNIVNLWN
ncbi:Nramp family divalent metal transporter [Blastopirellula sp. JC732]|uniref:Nramp family divalent metal transporter n=1 Tax=Blastopirellula sediminis TaxID=2894196 RepID=A0A9X1SFT4_9BACT|nr:Nramp family divalent metal transporter [Blastopirellula sediminis]MCC9609357.1 Nramp family divalent metal transporter [Blastopirellula sediminis]MCC9627866.1 Nramp family divalent metal transporter [Blastopirellula sediminis]